MVEPTAQIDREKEKTKIEEIFRPFEQLAQPNSLAQKGTGLGLSVTKQLIEQHDGQIWVNAVLGEGSQFYFTLPCWLDNFHSEDEVTRKESMITFEKEEQTTLPPISKQDQIAVSIPSRGKILIADDDPINLQVLNDLLEMNHYEVVCAHDGLEATKIGLSEKFDLAIIDIMMPGLSGYDVTKKLRAKYNAIELPILLLSARNQPGDVTAGFEAGANDYVTKPIRARALLARIKSLLRRIDPERVNQANKDLLSFGSLSIDIKSRTAKLVKVSLELSSNEFNVLWILASQAGEIVSRESLIKELRGIEYDGFDRSTDILVSRLRKKLNSEESEQQRIKTIWGKGYLFSPNEF